MELIHRSCALYPSTKHFWLQEAIQAAIILQNQALSLENQTSSF